MNQQREWVFLNGDILPSEEAKIHVGDIAILRGYGAFDFFRVIGGRPVFMEDYLNRFERSVKALHLTHPFSRIDLRNAIFELIARNNAPLLGIRLVCTGGVSPDAYTPTTANTIILAKPFTFHPYEQGLALATFDFQRELFQAKSTNYLFPVAMLPRLNELKADDVLYYRDGLISESSRSNVFLVKKGTLITPDTGMLEGITRKRILSFANEILPTEVRPVYLDEVYEADEVFLSASTKRISPVTRVDNSHFGSGPYTQALYQRLVLEEQAES